MMVGNGLVSFSHYAISEEVVTWFSLATFRLGSEQ